MKTYAFKRNQGGLTLVEVLASVTVAAAILAALSAPMAVGIINRRQGQDVTQATNLAQMEIESIRRNWQTAELIPGVSGQPPSMTKGQQNYDNNVVSVAWNQAAVGCVPGSPITVIPEVTADITYDAIDTTTTPGTPIKVLNNPSNISPNSGSITAGLNNVRIDANNDCAQDYWGQVVVSNIASANPTSGATYTAGMKRIVVRIFRKQSVLASLDYIPVNTRTSLYNASGIQKTALTNAAGAPVDVSFLDLPVVVLVADIARS
jgi:type II secretory pathway pseudopilin PulG